MNEDGRMTAFPTKTERQMQELHQRAYGIAVQISYKLGYGLIVDREQWPIAGEKRGRVFLQVVGFIDDAVTGEEGPQKGRKWYLSPHMTDGEIVRTTFMAYLAFEEHGCREAFTYKGARVFGPHISVDALVEIAERTETRD